MYVCVVCQLSDRLGLTLTLLLTVVAFKLVAKSFLPTTTYQTLMDQYIMAAFLLLGTGVCHRRPMPVRTCEGRRLCGCASTLLHAGPRLLMPPDAVTRGFVVCACVCFRALLCVHVCVQW